MNPISSLIPTYTPKKSEESYRDERDYLIKKAVKHINELRKGTDFESKVETPAKLAVRVNQNIFLSKHRDNGELERVLRDCEKRGSYATFYWLLKQK